MANSELEVALSKPIVEINSAGQSKIVWTSVAGLVIAGITAVAPIDQSYKDTITSTLTLGGPLLVMYFRIFGMGKKVSSAFPDNGSGTVKLLMDDGSIRTPPKP
jgi:hypothetical protein